MRKLTALFIISILVLLVFATGCADKDEENGRKLVSSRPVTTEESSSAEQTTVVEEESGSTEAETKPAETPTKPASKPKAGQAYCEQLTLSDLGSVFGGTWKKTSDCPQRPAMPKGVDVCRCDYDGPKNIYLNVETQLYDDADEAERVYNMYCKGTAEESEVGTYSCRVARTNELRPNFIYFLDGNYFVKVACLGGTCKMTDIVEMAKKVDAKI
ncbi:hypothetical protein ACFL3V_02025 [Nanoarchaeota archaeon]